jgi:hypothetical protein
MKSLALIGGTFSETPKRSKIIDFMYQTIASVSSDYGLETLLYRNSGYLQELPDLLAQLEPFQVVLWFPNIANDAEKIRNIKELYPHKFLVTSKRNDDRKYSLGFLVNHALTLHANLFVEFIPGLRIIGRLLDPLGNVWCDYTEDVQKLTYRLLNRLDHLSLATRQGSIRRGDSIPVPNLEEFFALVKEYAVVFHKFVDPEKEVTRFMGNTSFRCDKGFPSFRVPHVPGCSPVGVDHEPSSIVFMSKRNIDKSHIDYDGFVATQLFEKKSYFFGPHKPSVDTPIQLRLYKAYPKINFMIHSHCYIDGAPFTKHHYPCGALEEVKEVIKTAPDTNSELVFLNLVGHGSLAMSKTLEGLKNIPYIQRPVPEIFD